jgi:hypothetical protein
MPKRISVLGMRPCMIENRRNARQTNKYRRRESINNIFVSSAAVSSLSYQTLPEARLMQAVKDRRARRFYHRCPLCVLIA